MPGKIISINSAARKGEKKTAARRTVLAEGGLPGDAHFGSEKEVSILDWGSVEALLKKNPGAGGIRPGDFAENITTKNLDLKKTRPGDSIFIFPPGRSRAKGGARADGAGKSGDVELIVTSVGKTCHGGCRIRQTLGDCVMPREGVFAKVVRGGAIRAGDAITLERAGDGQKKDTPA